MDRSAHSKVDTESANRIKKPPMVGVPCLATICRSGPSSRIGCPRPCLLRNQRIRGGPRMKLMIRAVITAAPVRKVK